jgi:leucyl aminopeptidase
LAGLGSENASAETVRNVAGKAARLLRDKPEAKKIAVEVLNGNGHATAEGTLLGLYRFDELRSSRRKQITEVNFVTVESDQQNQLNTGIVYARSQNTTRKLAELPANHATPTFFCQQATKLFANIANVKVIEHDVAWAESKKVRTLCQS